MRIAVLGGGHGCYAAACDFAQAGHEVRLWRRDATSLAPVQAAGGITVKDHRGSRHVAIGNITGDLAAAVRGAELIFSPLPAFAQADVARLLAPHLTDGQVLFIPPGTFGSYVMSRIAREAGSRARFAIAETGTLPWLTRKHGETHVAITTRASRLPTGVFPAKETKHALEIVAQAFPGVIEPVKDALSAALMNAGPIIHPPLILMNAGAIAHFPRWDIHKEGTQPTIRRVHDGLDAERIRVREALGYGPPHFPLADHYTTSNWMYGNLAHDKLVDSGDWHEKLDLDTHRYMAEDVEMGLAFLASVCRWAGIPCPTADALLQLGALVAGRDFDRTGRTLETLKLASLSRADMAELLSEGV